MSEPWLDPQVDRSLENDRFRGGAGIPAPGRDTPCDRAPKLSTETLGQRNSLSTVIGYRLLASAPEDGIATIRDDIQQCLYLS
jgi:hypothetical protein